MTKSVSSWMHYVIEFNQIQKKEMIQQEYTLIV